jgi:TATA-binding protein-associated factor Taf7
MIIERTKKEVIIRLHPSVDTEELQELANYFRYKEITSKYKTDQSEVDKLSSEINKKWYKSNRERLLK